jgi:hypothetical protein
MKSRTALLELFKDCSEWRAFFRSCCETSALRACYELGRKSHRNADFTISLVPSRSLFPAFLSRF